MVADRMEIIPKSINLLQAHTQHLEAHIPKKYLFLFRSGSEETKEVPLTQCLFKKSLSHYKN